MEAKKALENTGVFQLTVATTERRAEAARMEASRRHDGIFPNLGDKEVSVGAKSIEIAFA